MSIDDINAVDTFIKKFFRTLWLFCRYPCRLYQGAYPVAACAPQELQSM